MKTKDIWMITWACLQILHVVIDYYNKNVDDEISRKLEDAYYDIMKINNDFYDSNIR